jgi:hypothetical protein
MATIPETKPTLKEVTGAGSVRLVSEIPPFGMLTAKQGAKIISRLRFPNDPQQRQELLSAQSLRLSSNELFLLIRADQLLAILDRLERMEKHYREVSKLDAKEVRRRFETADPDDFGAFAYKKCLTEEGADPRLQIAERILSLISIARRHLEWRKPALELNEIMLLNEQANMLLITPHLERGLDILADAQAGGRRRNPAGTDERREFAQEFLEARKARPSLTQREFARNCTPPVCVKTLQRGLKDLRSSPL